MLPLPPPRTEPWAARDLATLLFVRRGHELLLIRKKRGLGAGKINAPGGRVEPGETTEQAAVREVQEEVGVTPTDVHLRGELRFSFVDGYTLRCLVYLADGHEGEPRESDEALPMWRAVDDLPYDEMWSDDALWLPRMLAGYGFFGRFTFDRERMLDHELLLDDPAEPLFARFAALGIATTTYTHRPVFTVEQAREARVAHDGVHLKNLFLRNKKGEMWLVSVPEDRPVALKEVGRELGAGNLSFGSAARLRAHLGVLPGSVTPLAALADTAGAVRVVLDRGLRDAPVVYCHPLTNDRTTAIAGADLVRFLEATGHPPAWW